MDISIANQSIVNVIIYHLFPSNYSTQKYEMTLFLSVIIYLFIINVVCLHLNIFIAIHYIW